MIKLKKERHIWFDKMLTLSTLAIMAFFYYGSHFAVMAVLSVLTAFAAELVSVRLMHEKPDPDDLSCTADGLLIALMMPASLNYVIAFLAALFGIVAAKNVFGGRKNMVFSPAAAAYLFVLTSWGRDMLTYPSPHDYVSLSGKTGVLVNSASHVFNMTGKMDYTDFEILMGNFSGPSGSVSILLILLAALILMLRKDISAGAFFGTIAGTALFAFTAPMIHDRSDSVKYSLVTNMVLFAAVYIVSDLRIAPRRWYFAFFYGLFIGIFAYVLVLTRAKENAIVIMSVLFTPAALGMRMLEKKIEHADDEAEKAEAAEKEAAEA